MVLYHFYVDISISHYTVYGNFSNFRFVIAALVDVALTVTIHTS